LRIAWKKFSTVSSVAFCYSIFGSRLTFENFCSAEAKDVAARCMSLRIAWGKFSTVSSEAISFGHGKFGSGLIFENFLSW